MRERAAGKKPSSFQIIILGCLAVILAGTGLLMLPTASAGGQRSSFETALFTSTSAVCVTGLVVKDTASYWSSFGQAVILVLIQIGGLGIVTVAAFIANISGRKMSLIQRSTLQDSISAHQIGGVVKMTTFIFTVVLIVETAGALLLLPVFCSEYGMCGIWMSAFHSVSAFCNAGFDIMGDKTGAFSSLTAYSARAGVVLPVCALIIFGGIGFLTWDDIVSHGFHLKRYRMQSKAILAGTAVLILLPATGLFFGEFSAHPLKERLLLSVFQAVTPRTAGFNTADIASMSGAGRAMTVVLMLIGGSPGSTAGGFKTTTLMVLIANAVSVFRRRKSPQMFGRRIEDETVKTAAALIMLYLLLTFLGALFISVREGLPIGTCVFETASAIGTVGLSMGITSSLGFASHLVLIGLMFFGRVGGLTLLYAAVSSRSTEIAQCPAEKISVG